MKYDYVVGIDEVGRGPVAGPVYVCALMIEAQKLEEFINSTGLPLRDSKKLTEKMRKKWFDKIQEYAKLGFLKYVVSSASSSEIDSKGIAVCIKASAQASVLKLNLDKEKTKVFLDGGLSVSSDFIQETVIKGDENIPVISLASIVAKVLRDEKMEDYAKKYPEYLFEKNKGYGTKAHLDAVKKFGLTELHRKSFLKNYI
ncbi:MAG: ribonuclease HII [Candidatus Paceibacterota bacterium]